MAEEVGALRVGVFANVAEIAGDLAKVRSVVNSSAAQMQRSMNNFAAGANRAFHEVVNLRNAGILLAAAATVAFVKRMTDMGDETAKTAQKMGITTDSLQELRYAAGLAGTSQEDFDRALLQLDKRLGDIKDGVTEAAQALGKLGISMDDVKGKRPDEVFKMITEQMSKLGVSSTTSALAADLFGKAGQQLLPILTGGTKALADMAVEAHKLGMVLSAETLKKAEEANDEFTRIGNALKVAGVNIAVGFLPALESLRNLITSSDFQDGIKTVSANFASLIKLMVDNKETIAQIAAVFVGFRVGSAFGPLGGIVGGAVALAAASRMARDEVTKLESELKGLEELRSYTAKQIATGTEPAQIAKLTTEYETLGGKIGDVSKRLTEAKAARDALEKEEKRITVNPAQKIIEHLPQVEEAIKKLQMQTRILRGDFDALAPGFPEAAMALKVFGNEGFEATGNLAALHPRLQELHAEMLVFQSRQITKEQMTPFEKAAIDVNNLNMAMATGEMSAETYARKLLEIKMPDFKQAADDAMNLGKQYDKALTGSVDKLGSSLTDVILQEKSAEEAMREFGKTVVRMFVEATVKALVFAAAMAFVRTLIPGGWGAKLLGFSEGGPVGMAGGGTITGPGTGISDSIPAWLSDGEYVVNARAAGQYRPLLDAINFGSTGGGEDAMPPSTAPAMVEVTWHGTEPGRREAAAMIRAINAATRDGYRININ